MEVSLMVAINPRVSLLSKELIERYRKVQLATLGHLIEFGFCDPSIQALWKPVKLVGPAFTVRTSALDSAIVHVAIDMAEPGDVLVIDRTGDRKHACWGDVTSLAAQLRGVAGVIVDGCVTDMDEIVKMRFPVYCRCVSAITTKGLALEGEINTPIQVGGVPVNPGDLIIADTNGVLVLSPLLAGKLIDACEAREKRETWIKEELHKGRLLSEISGASEKLKARIGSQI